MQINKEALSDFIITLIAVISAVVLVYGLMYWGGSLTCAAKTRDMGMAHRYTLISSCMIQVKPNLWIPLESYVYKP